MYIKTEGLVLRESSYNDSDKLLTVLTRSDGKLTLKAGGVRSRSSRKKAGCQLLCWSEFTIFEYRGFYSINEAEPLESFSALRGDLQKLSLGSYIAQLLEAVSDSDTQSPELLPLGLNSLYALCRLDRPPELIKAAFELRLLCLAGYEPSLEGCALCGRPDADRFDTGQGRLVCSGCGGNGTDIGPGVLAAMRHICFCPPKRIFSFTLPQEQLKELETLCENYLLCQLGRNFSTLDFYKSLEYS